MRYLLIGAACLTACFAAGAAELDKQHRQLQIEVVSALREKGFKPDIDKDGDVYIDKNNRRYWIEINESWSDPYIITVYNLDTYDSSIGWSRENVESCVSMVNQAKTVKLYCKDYTFMLRTDMLCRSVDVFSKTLGSVLDELDKATQYLVETINAGLGGVDLTGNKEAMFDKAAQAYLNSDYYKAFKLFEFLADSGYAPAYAMLGMAYENGDGTAKDEAKMVASYEKAIEGGESWCAYNLGNYYLSKGNNAKALKYYTQASATDNMFRSEGYYMVGKMNEEGKGTPRDEAKAIQNYKKSVEYSSELECDAREALSRLGVQAEKISDFKDIEKGKLAGMTPESMFRKGYEYEHGLNNRAVSLPLAFGYYKAAADKDYTDALVKMGEIYISGYYPFNDKDKSDKYYARALKALKKIEAFNGNACYQLGIIYKKGFGVTVNPELAMEYFRSASDKGSMDADYELGLAYQADQEHVDGFNYFLKAAQKGHPKAMLEVAEAYGSGMGTARDREKAVEWYTKCATQDTDRKVSKEARDALRKLGRMDNEKE